MKLIPYDIDKVKGRMQYKRSENLRILEEFAKSELECAKVEDYSCENAHNCAASLRNSIKRYKFADITVSARKGEVYLIRRK